MNRMKLTSLVPLAVAMLFIMIATAWAQQEPGVSEPKTDEVNIADPTPRRLDLEILEDVKRRQSALDEKEEELKQKEERLLAIESEIEKQLTELKIIQARIDERIELRNDLEKVAIKRLAKTYSSMPPENAAILIGQIETSIAIKVLAVMKAKSAGKILAVTPPALASRLSEGLVKKR